MSNKKNPLTSPDMQRYLSSQPVFIQESIAQSGVKFESLDQLRSFVDGLNHKN